jgi:hypothetical protein
MGDGGACVDRSTVTPKSTMTRLCASIQRTVEADGARERDIP